MTTMLIIVAVLIYNQVISGPGGTKEQVRHIGGTMNETIQSINP